MYYNSSNTVVTLTPSAVLAVLHDLHGDPQRRKDLAGNTMASVSWSFTTTAAAASSNSMVLADYNGTSVPLNGDGDLYPSEGPYRAAYRNSGGTGTTTINTTDAIEGNSLLVRLDPEDCWACSSTPITTTALLATRKKLRGFAREY